MSNGLISDDDQEFVDLVRRSINLPDWSLATTLKSYLGLTSLCDRVPSHMLEILSKINCMLTMKHAGTFPKIGDWDVAINKLDEIITEYERRNL